MKHNIPISLKFRWLRERLISFIFGLLLILFFTYPSIIATQFFFKINDIRSTYTEFLDKYPITIGEIKEIRRIEITKVIGRQYVEIEYVFKKDGKEVEASIQTFDIDSTKDLKVGDWVAVEYFGNESRIKDIVPVELPMKFFAAGIILITLFFYFPLLAGILLLLYSLHIVYQKSWLHRYGVKAFATITNIRQTANNQFIVDYEFKDHRGKPIKNSLELYDYSAIAGKKIGDFLDIVHDPKTYHKNFIYELLKSSKVKEPQVITTLYNPSWRNRWIALILCMFLGTFGVHRFYAGKFGTGILMLLTMGGFWIWVIIDIILIVSGKFTDSKGNYI